VYMLWSFQKVFTGKPSTKHPRVSDLNFREIAVVAPLLALSLFLGLYPKPALDRIEPSVKRTIVNLELKTDFEETRPEGASKTKLPGVQRGDSVDLVRGRTGQDGAGTK